MTEEEKLQQGLLFCPSDPKLKAMKLRAHNLNIRYNTTFEDEAEKRDALLDEMLGHKGINCFIQGPVFFHYGKHTSVGDRFFANFNFTVQDDASVTIGNDCNFGPNTTIVTPLHPMVPVERKAMLDKEGHPTRLCYAKPVKIGNDCWFGANVVVCPGVTIGDGCVIGAGSVVIRDIPSNVFAAGTPCKVIRHLTEKESMKYRPELLAGYRVPSQTTL